MKTFFRAMIETAYFSNAYSKLWNCSISYIHFLGLSERVKNATILQIFSLIVIILFTLLSSVFSSLLQILINIFPLCNLPPSFYRYNGIYRTMFLWTLYCHVPSSHDHTKLGYKSVTHSYSFSNIKCARNSKEQDSKTVIPKVLGNCVTFLFLP